MYCWKPVGYHVLRCFLVLTSLVFNFDFEVSMSSGPWFASLGQWTYCLPVQGFSGPWRMEKFWLLTFEGKGKTCLRNVGSDIPRGASWNLRWHNILTYVAVETSKLVVLTLFGWRWGLILDFWLGDFCMRQTDFKSLIACRSVCLVNMVIIWRWTIFHNYTWYCVTFFLKFVVILFCRLRITFI